MTVQNPETQPLSCLGVKWTSKYKFVVIGAIGVLCALALALTIALKFFNITMKTKNTHQIDLASFNLDNFSTSSGTTFSDYVFTDERTGEDNGIENRLWYFREDYFINSHHHFWHTYHTEHHESIPDRTGELLYFMHHEFLARYWIERWSAGLDILPKLEFTEKTLISEGYDSHLSYRSAGDQPPPRPPNQYIRDVSVVFNITVERAITIHRRLFEAIELERFFMSNGAALPITHSDGINVIGHVLLSVGNYPLDGIDAYQQDTLGFHAMGHTLIARIMDPDGALNLDPGVMRPSSTSMRDPVFYRYHAMVENIFQAHKSKLEPYSPMGAEFPLLWNAVNMLSIEVKSSKNRKPNQLFTYWSKVDFNATFGLDWSKNSSEPVRVCAKQLDHEPFHYNIHYESFNKESLATVRIFLAPRFYMDGTRIPMKEQYKLFFTLDRFTVNLKPGKNIITRSSGESSLTLPDKTWLEIKDNAYNESYCGCGLPSHLLLPKGTPEGKVYDLFVMLTNGSEDAPADKTEVMEGSCQSAPVWCVNYGKKYNDARPMGYPFDRRPFEIQHGNSMKAVADLEEYMRDIGNMHAVQVTIKHLE